MRVYDLCNFVRAIIMQLATLFALSCPDILEPIFGWLCLNDCIQHLERESRRRALCPAALVSRTFSRHALDKLWDTLDQIHPLLSLLPHFRYDESLDACVSHWLEYS